MEYNILLALPHEFLAGTDQYKHSRIRDIAIATGRSLTVVHTTLRRMARHGLVTQDPAGWRMTRAVIAFGQFRGHYMSLDEARFSRQNP